MLKLKALEKTSKNRGKILWNVFSLYLKAEKHRIWGSKVKKDTIPKYFLLDYFFPQS